MNKKKTWNRVDLENNRMDQLAVMLLRKGRTLNYVAKVTGYTPSQVWYRGMTVDVRTTDYRNGRTAEALKELGEMVRSCRAMNDRVDKMIRVTRNQLRRKAA